MNLEFMKVFIILVGVAKASHTQSYIFYRFIFRIEYKDGENQFLSERRYQFNIE